MAKKKRNLAKRPTRGELFSALRELYGGLTTDADDDDGGMIVRRWIDLGIHSGIPVDNVLVINRKLKPHLKRISKLMDREAEARGSF